MMSASEREIFLSTNLASDNDSSYSFLVGLPIQVMWIDKHQHGDDNVDMNQSLRSLKSKRRHGSARTRGESDKNLESKKQRLNLEAVPEMVSSSWEDLEVDSFVLGLYTFGKNFTQIKRFMEKKGTGDIVLFYYSKFYNSGKYNIWFNSHKKKSRKCVSGRKLYSGWRQQMLLSRLIPSMAVESQKQMVVSKSFAEGSITLEKYVTSVKDLVGLRLLVDAVAIGKEKEEDLTVLSRGLVKNKSWFTVSSKPSSAPSMGAYTSLTASDIVDQLTGCSRLSKARCSDIFWEAVWPRLLARGWHSEQLKDRGYFTSKDNIVFIIPGVKRFSRGKHVKGEHYFDSVSDILTKVALDPELLEFEADGEIREAATNEFAGEENSSDQSDEESSPSDSQRYCYLRSPCSNRGDQQMKFTVVDTSSAAGGKLCGLRNLKAENIVSQPKTCLREISSSVLAIPMDIQNVEKSQVVMPLDVKNQVDDSTRFSIVDTSLNHREKSSRCRRWRHLPSGGDTERGHVGADFGIKEETLEKVDETSKRSVKHKFSRQGEEIDYHSGNSAPLLKRRRLSTCIRKEVNMARQSPVFKNLPCGGTERTVSPESNHLSLRAVQQQNSICEEMNEDKERDETMLSEDQPKKTGTRLSEIQEMSEIKLNGLNSISCVDINFSPEEIRAEQEPNRLCSVSNSDKKHDSNDLGTTQELGSSERQQQQPDQQISTDGPRRQSTRKRPLTIRALEAIESDFITSKRMNSSTTKPTKRQSSRKEHSAKACNRAQALSDNVSADLEQRGEEGSTFAMKAIASKPLNQIEDSKPSFLLNEAKSTESKAPDPIQVSTPTLTEHTKLPPIVLKLSRKRG
ncbi:unnamed protein product [Cochlearia groenlandica]